jgi:hypothetical protein
MLDRLLARSVSEREGASGMQGREGWPGKPPFSFSIARNGETMDLNEFYRNCAEVSRLRAVKALRDGDPKSAIRHLRNSRQDKRTASLYEPGKVSDIRSAKNKKRK